MNRLLLLVTLLAQINSGLCYLRKNLSFVGPFDDVFLGKRIVGENWKVSGSTEVLQHFIRLTPEKHNSEGHLWNEEVIKSNQFALIFTFRISGQEKNNFGNGIALWLTHHSTLVRGAKYGFADDYYGLGIFLDSSGSRGQASNTYKDISVRVNNGKKSNEQIDAEEKIGCSAMLRYHENHAGWNPVYNSSRVKVMVMNTNVTIYFDENNTGRWTICWTGIVPLSSDWGYKAKLAISSVTDNVLADNHDALRLDFYEFLEDPSMAQSDSHSVIHNLGFEYEKWINTESCGVDCKLAILQKQMKDFQMDFEYKMKEMKEKSSVTINTLKAKEEDNLKKIKQLEDYVANKVEEKVDLTMGAVGEQIQNTVQQSIEQTVVKSGAAWRLPFLFLLLGLCGVCGVVYQKYTSLRKSHLL